VISGTQGSFNEVPLLWKSYKDDIREEIISHLSGRSEEIPLCTRRELILRLLSAILTFKVYAQLVKLLSYD